MAKRITVRRMMLAVALVAVALGTARALFRSARAKDLLVSALVGHDTVYANGYSESAWRKLRIGMTPAQVTGTMGAPLVTFAYRDGRLIWCYTVSPRGSHFWRRWVEFRAGKVSSIATDFYFD